MERRKRFFLINGNALSFRAYYALSPLVNSGGRVTTAMYGFTTMLMKLLKDQEPDYVAVAFHLPAPRVRHKGFVEYQAKRPKMPPDLQGQLPRIKEIITAFGIPIFEREEYEVNDILGTLAKAARKIPSVEVLIITDDKSALQLVENQVKVLNPHQDNFLYDRYTVMERFGFEPHLIPHWLSLAGDESENIPGVPGIGRIQAETLIKKYGSLEEVLRHATQIPQRQGELLRKYSEVARKSLLIATIDTNVPIDFDLEKCRLKKYDRPKLIELFRKFGFLSLLSEISAPTLDTHPIESSYKTVLENETLAILIERLRETDEFAIDTETTGVNPMKAELVGLSICLQPKEAFYIPLGHEYPEVPLQLKRTRVLEALRPILEDKNRKKIGQNIKYDALVLRRAGLQIEGVGFDTMVGSWMLNPSIGGHNLDALAMEYLGYKPIPIHGLIGPGKTMAQVEIGSATKYAAEDADIALRLKHILEPRLKQEGLTDLFNAVEMPLVAILTDMEFNGVMLDVDRLKKLSDQLKEKIANIVEEIYRLAGVAFNLNSSSQLKHILFTKLALSGSKLSRGKKPSVTLKSLKKLAALHPIVTKIMEYREAKYLKAAYVDTLLESADPKTKRIHPSYNPIAALTGRLTCAHPKIGDMLLHPKIGRAVSEAIIPSSDSVFLIASYPHIELRILSHLSHEKRLIDAFIAHRDIYAEMASQLFGPKTESVTDENRWRAKATVASIINGDSLNSVATELKLSRKASQELITAYATAYPKINQYLWGTLEKTRREKYATTILKRKRWLPEINSPNHRIRKNAEREARMIPIRGSANDLMKLIIVRIYQKMKQVDTKSHMVLLVNNRLIVEAPEDEKELVVRLLREEMANAATLRVPLEAEIGVGKNLLDALN